MKFVFNMPFWSCPPNPAFVSQDAIMSLSAAAEEAGFSAVAFTEHPIPSEGWRQTGGHDAIDPFIGLAFAAAATRRLRLLTYLVVLPYRNPFLLAKSVATLDALSGGRLTLGLGAGYLKSEFFALGVKFEERNALFDEALEVLKLAWKGEPLTYQGIHFSAQAVTAQPRPAQLPHPPLWLGGNSKLTIRRVAEHAQGWMVMPSTAEQAVRRRSLPLEGLKDLEARLTELRTYANSIGRKDPISIHYPLTEEHDAQDAAGAASMIRSMSDLGVEWTGWQSPGTTVAKVKDEIRRFGDEVIGKVGS